MQRIIQISLIIFIMSINCSSLLASDVGGDNTASKIKEYVYYAQKAEKSYLYSESLSWYDKAIALDDNNAAWHLGAARQLIGLERLEDAVEQLHRVIELDSANAEAYTMLGVYHQKMVNQFPEAERNYKLAIAAETQYARPRRLLGELLILMQRLDDARIVYQELCKIAPDDYHGHFGLGNALLKLKQYEAAIAELKRSMKIDPTEPESYRMLGQALAKTGQREESKKALKQYKEKKELKNKLKIALRVVRRNPTKADNWLRLGGLYMRQRDALKAIKAFEHGLGIEPTRTSIYGYVGMLHLQLRDYKQALNSFEKAAELNPKQPEYFNNIGVCQMFLRNYEKAVKAFEKSIELGNKDPRINQNLQSAIEKMEQGSEVLK